MHQQWRVDLVFAFCCVLDHCVASDTTKGSVKYPGMRQSTKCCNCAQAAKSLKHGHQNDNYSTNETKIFVTDLRNSFVFLCRLYMKYKQKASEKQTAWT